MRKSWSKEIDKLWFKIYVGEPITETKPDYTDPRYNINRFG
jgi:hypothetical protein